MHFVMVYMLSQFAHVLWEARGFALVIGLLLLCVSAQGQINDCDLNNDGKVNVGDLQLALDMGPVGSSTCVTNIDGGVCNNLFTLVLYSILNGTCHTVSLSWTASTTPNVTYNVYRGSTS